MKFIPITKRQSPPKLNKRLSLIALSALGGFIGGFFGSGGGIIFVFILKKYFRDEKSIFPTTILITLFTSALNSIVYSRHFPTSDYSPLGFIFGILGALTGCLLYDKIKFKFLNLLFSLLIIISGLIMIF